jgi:hypothetical protein
LWSSDFLSNGYFNTQETIATENAWLDETLIARDCQLQWVLSACKNGDQNHGSRSMMDSFIDLAARVVEIYVCDDLRPLAIRNITYLTINPASRFDQGFRFDLNDSS